MPIFRIRSTATEQATSSSAVQSMAYALFTCNSNLARTESSASGMLIENGGCSCSYDGRSSTLMTVRALSATRAIAPLAPSTAPPPSSLRVSGVTLAGSRIAVSSSVCPTLVSSPSQILQIIPNRSINATDGVPCGRRVTSFQPFTISASSPEAFKNPMSESGNGTATTTGMLCFRAAMATAR